MIKELGVITADIVSSHKMEPQRRESLYAAMKQFLDQMKKDGWISAVEIYRGDSFQCIAAKKEYSLRVALLIRCFIKSYHTPAEKKKVNEKIKRGVFFMLSARQDIRIAIGIGKAEFYSPKNLAHSDGEAFHLSGRTVDELKGLQYHLAVKTMNPKFNDSLEPGILLLDALFQKLSSGQAEAILYKLKNMKEEEIGEILGVTQSAVNQRLKSGYWYAVETMVTYFEKILKGQLE